MKKFCFECKYAVKDGVHFCHNPKAFYENAVTGVGMLTHCAILREDNEKCGPDGIWFEQNTDSKPIVDEWLEKIMETEEKS